MVLVGRHPLYIRRLRAGISTTALIELGGLDVRGALQFPVGSGDPLS
jgi:hypothetical protein